MAEVAASENAVTGVGSEIQRLADLEILGVPPRTRAAICTLLRDVFGNPFRPVVPNMKRLKRKAVNLAQSIYDDRAFERMPNLADALDEAGCTSAEILNHCRSEGPHVRGCWVVDLILGKQ